MHKHSQKIIVTLRFSILSIFIVLFVAMIITLLTVTYIRFSHSLTFTAMQLMEKASWEVRHKLADALGTADNAEQFSIRLMQEGILNAQNQQQMIVYMYNLLKHARNVQGVMWGNAQGDSIVVEQQIDGTLHVYIIDHRTHPLKKKVLFYDLQNRLIKHSMIDDVSYDPRTRPWYTKAKENQDRTWVDAYIYQLNHHLGITTTQAAYEPDGTLIGAFGLNIELRYLSRFVLGERVTPHAIIYIVRNDGKVIALPQLENQQQFATHQLNLIDVHALPPSALAESFDLYQKTHQAKFLFSAHGQRYLASYLPVDEMAANGWLIGVIIPEDDFIQPLKNVNTLNLILGLSILIFGIILVSILVSHVVRPLKNLVRETERIKNFDLSGNTLVRSRIKEIMRLSRAIHAMKIGLKSFRRYVPAELVRQLIETGANAKLSGSKKQLAIFFSDIQDFTALAARLDPTELLKHINEYFDELSKIIVQEKGTIDKYIGDSIMAFWGAPLVDQHPAHHAAHAALLCAARIDELNAKWQQENKPLLITRIGLHLGDAIVGNIGSSERLNYTTIGDTVNIASHLQNINKIYDSRIIVSDVMYEVIKNHFVLRLLDCVRIKGKDHCNYIYELLAENANQLPFDVAAYQTHFMQGFTHYQQQAWEQAIQSFALCNTFYPTDKLADLFIQRCKQFELTPPGKDWNGVWID